MHFSDLLTKMQLKLVILSFALHKCQLSQNEKKSRSLIGTALLRSPKLRLKLL